MRPKKPLNTQPTFFFKSVACSYCSADGPLLGHSHHCGAFSRWSARRSHCSAIAKSLALSRGARVLGTIPSGRGMSNLLQRRVSDAKTAAVRSASFRRNALKLLNGISIGLRSGEYCGRYCNVASAAWLASFTPGTLWAGGCLPSRCRHD
jgi:hypothetical protein